MIETEPERLPPQWAQIRGVRVHYVHADDGPADGPTFVLVHGLGGALVNWDSLIPLLLPYGQVYALDLGGHGLSELGDPRDATVRRNRTLLDEFLRTVVGHPAVLIGNSMGGLISATQAAQSPGTVAGVVLIDPVLPLSPTAPAHPLVTVAFGIYAVPALGRRFMAARGAKVPARRLVRDVFKLVTADVRKVPTWLFERHVELAELREQTPHGDEAFLVAARSIVVEAGVRRTAYEQSFAHILHPVLLVHGDRDRLVNVAAARSMARRRRGWTYAEGAGLGHCPMFEDPQWVAEHVLAWLSSHPRITERAAARAGAR